MPVEIKQVTYGSAARRKALELRARKGYRKVGGGAFAKVYAKNNQKTVIKIGPMDDAYVGYVRALASAKRTNPFLPVISKVTFYVPSERYGKTLSNSRWRSWRWNPKNDGFYVVEMERLVKLGKAHQDLYPTGETTDVFNRTLTWGDPPERWMLYVPGLKGADKKIMSAFNRAVRLIRGAQRRVGGCWDLHGGNIMLRGTQLVVTDPIS